MTAITSLDNGTASLADLLGRARSPLAGTVDQLNRLAPLLDNDKDRLRRQPPAAPELYRKLARVGSYGAFFPYYICGIAFRASDLQGRTVQFPVDQTRYGEVRGKLMLRYRGSKLIRAGVIGVILIILVIAVGLQPERLLQYATAIRYQALFSEAGGLDRRQRRDGVGNQGRHGLVDRTRQRRRARRRSPSTASTRSARKPPRTSAPERCSASGCWPWIPRAAARSTPSQTIPTTAYVVAVLLDRRGQ